ncbi:MAG: hypothetical protein IPK19_08310 [Chloroflexi bacterium]|nr:hypothetical protein [Chloroflexota bacterium]
MERKFLEHPQAAAEALDGCARICVEFLYRARPRDLAACAVFDYALRSRFDEVARSDRGAVLFLCADEDVASSLDPILEGYPALRTAWAVINPPVLVPGSEDADSTTPTRAHWDDAGCWTQMAYSDRWARIRFALDVGMRLNAPAALIMPAHDAVWGRGLLNRLVAASHRYGTASTPAAVSPYTPYAHGPVPGVDLPDWAIDAINAAFNRDFWLRWRMARGRYQSFWGKTGLIPSVLCAEVLRRADPRVWEDDLEIDRAIREAAGPVRALWIGNPRLYRQVLPIFDEVALRRVIDRTLHYSLNIPAKTLAGSSLLMTELAWPLRLRRILDRRYDRAIALADRLAADCLSDARARLASTGMTWIDWGNYRYVVRPGDPFVQVWFHNDCL